MLKALWKFLTETPPPGPPSYPAITTKRIGPNAWKKSWVYSTESWMSNPFDMVMGELLSDHKVSNIHTDYSILNSNPAGNARDEQYEIYYRQS